MKRWLLRIAVFCLLLAMLAAVWLWQDMQRQLHAPMPVAETTTLEIKSGTSLRGLSQELVARGWLAQPYYLLLHARYTGDGGRIKAGEYAVTPGTTPQELLDQIVAGRVVQHTLTVVEGWNYRDLLRALRRHERIENTLAPELIDDPAGLMQALQLDDDHPEGRFYPDTYHFPSGTTDADFLRRAYRRMAETLAQEWQKRGADLPYDNAYEALIMASIIEKETAVPAERDEIAGVFVRRLQKGMRLQTDPTVIYAMGQQYDGNIRRKDLQIDSPYNTYVSDGLPPTPIALPGRESIHAALHPAAGSALYFVSRGDGSHYFSDTLREHNRAVAKYQLGRDIDLEKE
ncbi:UPF0755 protein [Methylohalomonas lacus]|uniref:Endolytic murein transglycosylase n=1 Tax=Methylohalomonas lacus TaxID=398773 RepID=A0AAE3HLI5_9GAMM|nr:endolytic transglycosylase MltG [Methylohalomonas lacus]MCS3902638.1 UPF0755 protein [Methylohalomonas lacus]